ncbi:unnamed protein product [Staurois parvus]|uniref:Uncharacterized protein n=1 Tax=Staurois parvus TaxID=386267 RepID=A0ABN9DQ73_9NEOB|nr:unnamed protein product [Staurois parvus]
MAAMTGTLIGFTDGCCDRYTQGWTDNSWGPRAIGIMGPLCPCPHSKHAQKSLLKR